MIFSVVFSFSCLDAVELPLSVLNGCYIDKGFL